MDKHIAVLDLGTNTFHLLLADAGTKQIIFEDTIAVKLGEGGINKGFITETAFERGLEAVRKFKLSIEQFEVEEIRTAGTAALRSASNGAYFIEEVKRQTGINIAIIDGELEAQLIYEGVKQAVNLGPRPVLIMDIGGGSVEFILCNNQTIYWKKSYPLGAARLMEGFHRHDPISIGEIEALHTHLDKELADLKNVAKTWSPELLIGSAGVFETYAALAMHRNQLPDQGQNISYFQFNLNQYHEISAYILSSTHAQRASDSNILPVRVDMIVVATLLTNYILQELALSAMTLSFYALKEGILFSDKFPSQKL